MAQCQNITKAQHKYVLYHCKKASDGRTKCIRYYIHDRVTLSVGDVQVYV